MAGCQSQDTSADLPGYQVVVPADVPQQYVVHGKDGQQLMVDGHAEYRWGLNRTAVIAGRYSA